MYKLTNTYSDKKLIIGTYLNLMHNYKLFFATLALCSILFCSCKKDTKPDSTPPVTVLDNTWTFSSFDYKYTSTYTVANSSHVTDLKAGKAILFEDNKVRSKVSLYMLFNEIPTKSGTYKIAFENDNPLANDECHIRGTEESGGFYYFFGNTDHSIDVILKPGNKIAITIPEILMTFSSPSAVYKLKGTIYEK
jgi:hypothetical protein